MAPELIKKADSAYYGVIYREIRIFSRASYEPYNAFFKRFQQRILLQLVPAVKLVYIQICRLILKPEKFEPCILKYFFKLLCTCSRRIYLLETGVHFRSDHPCKSRLSRTRRAVKYRRLKCLVFYRIIKQRAFVKKMLLTVKLIESLRPHRSRKRYHQYSTPSRADTPLSNGCFIFSMSVT